MTSSLNFNLLNNLQYWHEALWQITSKYPNKEGHFRDAISHNNMQAAIWAVEEMIPIVRRESLNVKLNILILNNWIGIPLVPLLCENLDVQSIDLVDIDSEANDLSKIFNKYYVNEKGIRLTHHTLDVPFAFAQLNAMQPDVVIHLNCEQLYPLAELKVNNSHAIYVMQSSNVSEERLGINCVSSSEELADQIDLSGVFYEGKKIQEVHTWQGRRFYDRFMTIGTK